jgi:hypothetical protein
MIKLNCEKIFKNFELISNDRILIKYSISPLTFVLKITKSPPKKSHPLSTFQQYQNACPNFPKIFSFDYFEISLKKNVDYDHDESSIPGKNKLDSSPYQSQQRYKRSVEKCERK